MCMAHPGPVQTVRGPVLPGRTEKKWKYLYILQKVQLERLGQMNDGVIENDT